MKQFFGILANRFYHKNDKKEYETLQEVGIMLCETQYVINGNSVDKKNELESVRFFISKENRNDMIEFLTNSKYMPSRCPVILLPIIRMLSLFQQ